MKTVTSTESQVVLLFALIVYSVCAHTHYKIHVKTHISFATFSHSFIILFSHRKICTEIEAKLMSIGMVYTLTQPNCWRREYECISKRHTLHVYGYFKVHTTILRIQNIENVRASARVVERAS